MLVADAGILPRGSSLLARTLRALEAAPLLVLLRSTGGDEECYRRIALALREGMPRSSRLLVHGRPDLARALGCGVHFPSRRASVPCPAGIPTTRAAHDAEEVDAAMRAGCAALVVGTVYETPSKPGCMPLGTAGLAALVERAGRPVYAIGGLNAERADAAVGAGAWGIACSRAILAADDPGDAARRLARALER